MVNHRYRFFMLFYIRHVNSHFFSQFFDILKIQGKKRNKTLKLQIFFTVYHSPAVPVVEKEYEYFGGICNCSRHVFEEGRQEETRAPSGNRQAPHRDDRDSNPGPLCCPFREGERKRLDEFIFTYVQVIGLGGHRIEGIE